MFTNEELILLEKERQMKIANNFSFNFDYSNNALEEVKEEIAYLDKQYKELNTFNSLFDSFIDSDFEDMDKEEIYERLIEEVDNLIDYWLEEDTEEAEKFIKTKEILKEYL